MATHIRRRIICLKSDKAPAQSFSFLYIILIICTIILICFYSFPLSVNTSTLKPLSGELMPTLENERETSQFFKREEKSILSELFGEISSLPLHPSLTETVIKTTTLSMPKADSLSSQASNVDDGDFTEDSPTDSNTLPSKNMVAISKQKYLETVSPTKRNAISKPQTDVDTVSHTNINATSKQKENFDTQPPTNMNTRSKPKEDFDRASPTERNATSKPNEDINSASSTNMNARSKLKEKYYSTTQSYSKIKYLETTEETQDTYSSNNAEYSSSTSATRSVSNPALTKNPKIDEKLQRKKSSTSQSINTTTDFKPEGEFLVFSDHCKIPNIDPYHPSILKYIEESDPLVCKGNEPITKTEGNTLFIDKEAIQRNHLNMSEITCLYMEIGRAKEGKSDDGIGLGFNHTLTDKAEIKAEFIRVICSFKNGDEFYEGFHTFVHDKPEVEKRCNQHNSSGYSVLIVGIDAMSRMNMHRQLKKTSRYLLKDMEAVEMYGFNKVGDNTFPNLIPLLTGYDARELKNVCWKSSKKNPLDKCNYVWKEYAKEGYRTFYAEDSPHISTFNYVKTGFHYQPTDYYIRHFMLILEQIMGIKKLLNTYACVGNISETEVVLRWTEQFASHFSDRKYFSFSWINGLTHDYLNKGSAVDHLYERLFRNLHTSGALNKTIVIVMGDHGMRWGRIRKTYIGRLEERLPMLVIALPPQFRKEHPLETKALQLNSRRLVTPFDLHATLINILHLNKNFTFINPDDVDTELAHNYTSRANTLFQPVPEDRSCDEASIDEHWCTCENSLPVDTDDRMVKQAADFLVDYINSLLKPVRNKCAELKLKSITDARVWTPPEEHQGHSVNDTILTIVVKVRPSGAIFEATVRTSEPYMNRDLLGTVSRLNLYGDQSACIQDADLKKYCYCS